MPNRIEPLIHHLRHALRPPDSDGTVLARFLVSRDEAAFEELVRRHGPMVLSLCRRVLGNLHDAEDAFQATFLVFLRKAATVSPRGNLGNWLYGVAYRTALHLRRRRPKEQPMQDVAQPCSDDWRALVPLLDQELVRLPDKYRVPLVLCELEGRPRREVARQLGIPEGTLSSRLATARKLLAKRLAKYGPFSGAVLAAFFAEAATAITPALLRTTVKQVLVGGEAAIAALAQGVLKAMLIAKLKTVSWSVALAVTMTAGVAGLRVVNAQAPLAQLAAAAGKPALTPDAPGAAIPATRSRVDDIDVLRLEIEALRKDLKITKDRVQALEAGQARVPATSGAVGIPGGLPTTTKSVPEKPLAGRTILVDNLGRVWQADNLGRVWQADNLGRVWQAPPAPMAPAAAPSASLPALRAPTAQAPSPDVPAAPSFIPAVPPSAALATPEDRQELEKLEQSIKRLKGRSSINPGVYEELTALERAVRRLKSLPSQAIMPAQPGGTYVPVTRADGSASPPPPPPPGALRAYVPITRADGSAAYEFVQSPAQIQELLKRLRKHPDDKKTLDALERAINHFLAGSPPPATPYVGPWSPSPPQAPTPQIQPRNP